MRAEGDDCAFHSPKSLIIGKEYFGIPGMNLQFTNACETQIDGIKGALVFTHPKSLVMGPRYWGFLSKLVVHKCIQLWWLDTD